MFELTGLFVAALVAATLLPAQSEAVLAVLVLTGDWPTGLLVLVATVGNVLGATINWALGRFLIRYSDRRWFPIGRQNLDKAAGWYSRWGYWSLLGSWLPVVGDPLTFAAGMMREPLWRFLLLVSVAKCGRYVLLAWATLQFTA